MTHTDQTFVIESRGIAAKRRTLRAIAVFEAIKGVAALAALVGIIDLMHQDVRHLAIELIGHFGLNPGAHYPSIVLHYADLLPNANMHALVPLASGYIFVQLLEAYGLWHDQAWSEWLGALSGGIYIPIEITHLMHRQSVINTIVLVANAFLVGFLTFQLWRRVKAHNHLV